MASTTSSSGGIKHFPVPRKHLITHKISEKIRNYKNQGSNTTFKVTNKLITGPPGTVPWKKSTKPNRCAHKIREGITFDPVQNMKEVVIWRICMSFRFWSTLISHRSWWSRDSNWVTQFVRNSVFGTLWIVWCHVIMKFEKKLGWIESKRLHMRHVTNSSIFWIGLKVMPRVLSVDTANSKHFILTCTLKGYRKYIKSTLKVSSIRSRIQKLNHFLNKIAISS